MADLTLQEFPSKRFKGKLVRTANAIDPSSRTLLVEVDVDNPKGDLLPGAYGQVHLKAAPGTPAVILPVSAMLFRSEGLQVAIVEIIVELRNKIALRHDKKLFCYFGNYGIGDSTQRFQTSRKIL